MNSNRTDPADMLAGDVLAVFARALSAEHTPLSTATAGAARSILSGYVRKRFPAISEQDIPDIVSYGVSRVVGRIDPNRNPAGYLLRAVHNAAVDQLRSSHRSNSPLPLTDYEMDEIPVRFLPDDEVALLIDRQATVERIKKLFSELHDSRDVTSLQVLTYMLNQAQQAGKAPSDRQTASALGISHTAVAKARKRLQAQLHVTE